MFWSTFSIFEAPVAIRIEDTVKIEKEEREELKSLLRQVVQDENKSGAKEIYNDVDEFLSLNKKIVDLT
ncbi:hypothetical protein HRED_10477, partial [Candidatus Haloredivivus sp. G17]